MSFLSIEGKTFAIFGLSNRKSVAWAIGKTLEEAGARVVYVARNEERLASLAKILDGRPALCCDVEDIAQIKGVADRIGKEFGPLAGFVHSIAFANFSEGWQSFHKTGREDFLQAMQISAFSLVELSNALKPHLLPDASVIAIGISSYVAAPTYGYLSPVKQALEGCVRFLAKSFAADSCVRFNCVNAGPLKTKSSAGIPGYLDNYLYAEKLTPRKKALQTEEVANVSAFLLSPRSSGINGQGIVVDAGMGWNFFDEEVVRLAMRPEPRG
ncbi:MAG: SDR family oxidoreductase [Opitutales bacterium]|nr:SDR family oxidoreductase [Opitutales bacterium]